MAKANKKEVKLVGFQCVAKVLVKVNNKVIYDGPGHFTSKDVPVKA